MSQDFFLTQRNAKYFSQTQIKSSFYPVTWQLSYWSAKICNLMNSRVTSGSWKFFLKSC